MRAWRRALRLGRPAAAKALGVSPRTVEKWELGGPIPASIARLTFYVSRFGVLEG
jgi:DNA-binding transcriptional regulator YiaG